MKTEVDQTKDIKHNKYYGPVLNLEIISFWLSFIGYLLKHKKKTKKNPFLKTHPIENRLIFKIKEKAE